MRATPALLADAALIVGFATLGRRSHEEGVSVAGVAEVAAPFLIALGIGWMASRAWRAPLSPSTGAIVWAVTAGGGLALRSVVFDRGIAPGFIVVALVVLGALLMGWRAAVRLAPRRRASAGT